MVKLIVKLKILNLLNKKKYLTKLIKYKHN